MNASSSPSPKRIVIVGGGFGGAYCARELAKLTRRRPDVDVLLIDQKNYLLFTPLLVEAGTGSLEPRHAVVPLRDFVPDAAFLMAVVTDIDVERRIVHCELSGTDYKREVSYDHLALAPGSTSRVPDVPGLAGLAFELKSIGDSVALRDRGIQMLEIANSIDDVERRRALLHIVVVGANFSGAEVAGEYLVFLTRAARRFPHIDAGDIKVTLVERGPRILPSLDPELSEFATKALRARGAEVILGETLAEASAESVTLTSGRRLMTHTVVWTAGIAPPRILEKLPFPKTPQGYLLCDPEMRVQGEPAVWAIGDSASNPAPDGSTYPPTAQHATRMGTQLARNIMRVIDGKEPLPCRIVSQGTLAALGCRTGVAKVLGFRLSGFPAWFLWRTVYLMKMPTWARRIRVAMDWTLDLFLRPDIVQLGVHRAPLRSGDGAPPPITPRT